MVDEYKYSYIRVCAYQKDFAKSLRKFSGQLGVQHAPTEDCVISATTIPTSYCIYAVIQQSQWAFQL